MTGSSGFIGRHLVAALAARGESVVAIDRRPGAHDGPVIEITADLLDRDDSVDTALREAGAVFHLAGCPGVRDHAPDVAHRRWRDNVLATERVVAAVPHRTALVVTSSSSVYGGTAGRGCRESDELKPVGGYAASKVQVELRCAARQEAGGAVVVARPFTVAGEHQRPDMAFAQWLDAARRGRPLRLLGSAARTRDVTDVLDVVHALMLLAVADVSGPVNVGTGTSHRLDVLAGVIADVTGATLDVSLEPADPDEVVHTRADTTLLARSTGFVPVTDLHALVTRQYAAAHAVAPVSATR